jgi:hypothetical protein
VNFLTEVGLTGPLACENCSWLLLMPGFNSAEVVISAISPGAIAVRSRPLPTATSFPLA